jgi:ABC-type sugar transport system ATPase subunit
MGYFLSLKDISKSFSGVLALDHVQLNIAQGEIHALVGENGAGKSTLIKIMSGVYKPDPGGYIEVEGNRIKLNDINESIACGISVIYQDLNLFPNLSVAENICIGKNVGKGGLISWINYN